MMLVVAGCESFRRQKYNRYLSFGWWSMGFVVATIVIPSYVYNRYWDGWIAEAGYENCQGGVAIGGARSYGTLYSLNPEACQQFKLENCSIIDDKFFDCRYSRRKYGKS